MTYIYYWLDKGTYDISERFAALAHHTGFEVLHSAADRHGAFEWACARQEENGKRWGPTRQYILLATIFDAQAPASGPVELRVIVEQDDKSARQLVAASPDIEYHSVPNWLEERWLSATNMLSKLH